MTRHIIILIAHSHGIFLNILQNILHNQREKYSIHAVSNLADLLQAATALKPDVIIADIALPGIIGAAWLRKLATSHKPQVIISCIKKMPDCCSRPGPPAFTTISCRRQRCGITSLPYKK